MCGPFMYGVRHRVKSRYDSGIKTGYVDRLALLVDHDFRVHRESRVDFIKQGGFEAREVKVSLTRDTPASRIKTP